MSAAQVISHKMFDGMYGDPFTLLLDPALCPSPNKRQRTTSSNSSRSSMSGYFYSPPVSEFNFSPAFPPQTTAPEDSYAIYAPPPIEPLPEQMFGGEPSSFFSHPTQTEPYFQQQIEQQWLQSASSTAMSQSNPQPNQFLDYPGDFDFQPNVITPGPSSMPARYLSADDTTTTITRATRAHSLASNASSAQSRDFSRGTSPSASEMSKWGTKNSDGSWSCAYPGCCSRSTFNRGCDLRKHFKRHTKSLFCRHEGCPQSVEGGFSSKKDRSRHEAKHNPGVVCEWDGCERLFSRQDNMKDHVRRVHKRRTS